MNNYTFQLTCGTEFTVPAATRKGAWIAAVEFLAEHGYIEDLSELTLNSVR